MNKLSDISEMMESEEEKAKAELDPFYSLDVLYFIGGMILKLAESIRDKNKCISLWDLSIALEHSCNGVNFARLWTSNNDIVLDSSLQDAIASLYESKEMVNSCMAWAKYDSSHAYSNILANMQYALNDIRKVIMTLEDTIFRAAPTSA